MDTVPGYVVVNKQDTMSESDRDKILIARDAHLNHKREALRMERQHLQREREVFQQQREQRDAAQRQEMQAAREVWIQSQQNQPGEVKGSPGPAKRVI